MLGESQEDVYKWSDVGYAGVEMESSTMFEVSKYVRVPCSVILCIADNLIEGEIVGSESQEAKTEMREKVRIHSYEIALKILLEL